MTTMTVAPTVGRRRGPVRRSDSSFINRDFLDATIGRVLAGWEVVPVQAEDPFLVSAGPNLVQVRPHPHGAVEAVEFIRDALGIPVTDVLGAVGIAERTFYGWKQAGRRPRPDAQGKLWIMTEVLYDLATRRRNLASWFHASPEVQRAFVAGDAGRLQVLDLQSSLGNRPHMVPDAVLFGDPGDLAGDADESGEIHFVQRPSLVAGRTRPVTRTSRPQRE